MCIRDSHHSNRQSANNLLSANCTLHPCLRRRTPSYSSRQSANNLLSANCTLHTCLRRRTPSYSKRQSANNLLSANCTLHTCLRRSTPSQKSLCSRRAQLQQVSELDQTQASRPLQLPQLEPSPRVRVEARAKFKSRFLRRNSSSRTRGN